MKKTLNAIFSSLVLLCSSAYAGAYQYTNNQLECQLQLEEFKWSKQHEINSEKNLTQSNEFDDVKSKLHNKIKKNFASELILRDQFNLEISQEMVQSELNRITAQTKKPAFLREIFTMFNHDPKKIANCLVRPQLIDRKLSEQYYWSSTIHSSIKDIAEFDFTKIDSNDSNIHSSAKISDLKFIDKKANLSSTSASEILHENITDLSNSIKLESGLNETKFAYEYQQITSESKDSLSVRIYSWQKESLSKWLENILSNYSESSVELNLLKSNNETYYLNEITKNTEFITDTDPSIYGDYWKNNYFTPYDEATDALWTGTEMIVWQSETPFAGGIYNPITDSWRPMSGINAPVNIYEMATYWTGEEMLAWGTNLYDDVPYSTGGFYNPETDTWRAMSSTGSPEPREYYSADWTGDELVVWGGSTNYAYKSTGFRYSLSNDIWTPMSNLGAPAPRHKASATFTGDKIIIWGGYLGNQLGYANSGSFYSLADDTWQTMSSTNAPTGRGRFFDVWTGDEFLVWGGSTHYTNVDTGGIYNPQTDTWRTLSAQNAPSGRTLAYSMPIWTGDELIIWGGDGYLEQSNEGAIYQLSTDTWSTTSINNAPSPRYFHGAVWTGDEMIVWGGSNKGNGGIYDPTTNTWRNLLNYNQEGAIIFHRLFWTGYEMLVFTLDLRSTGRKYDPTLNYWFDINYENSPGSRGGYSAVWSGQELIIWGGKCNQPNCPMQVIGGSYNPLLNQWFSMSDLNSPIIRSDPKAVWTGEQMIVWGGSINNVGLNSGGIYNRLNDSWSLISDVGAPPMRNYHTFWTGNKMLVWGYESRPNNSNVVFTNGYQFDPFVNTWSEVSEINEPHHNQYSMAVWTGEEMIVWGGEFDGVAVNTGSIYNPLNDSWEKTSTTGAPDSIYNQQALWTGSEMIVWDTNNKGIFNPTTNSWRNMQDNEVNGQIVWADNEMFVWGSGNYNGQRLNIYVPHTEFIFMNGFESN